MKRLLADPWEQAIAKYPVDSKHTGTVARLADLGARLIVSTLDGLLRRSLEPVDQPAEGVTYAHKLGKEEGVLDWRRPAAELERKVRAFHPWPGTSFEAPKEGGVERIKVLAAALTLAGGPPGSVTIARDGMEIEVPFADEPAAS